MPSSMPKSIITSPSLSRAKQSNQRCFYLDWLRFFAVLGVFLIHVAEPFTPYGPLKNDRTSMAMTVSAGFLFFWIMPLFFFLAGASAKFALDVRTSLQFLRERFLRLIIPYIAGVLILIPPMVYITGLSHSWIHCSFLAYYPQFFKNLNFVGSLGFLSTLGGHLWFLPFLFLISLLTLNLFLYLRTPSGQTPISKIASLCERYGLLTLFIIPVVLIHLAFKVGFGTYGWRNLLYFLPFYVLGFVVFSNKRFAQMIERKTLTALLVGILCFAFLATIYVAGFGEKLETNPSWSALFVLYSVIRSLNVLAWIFFVMGIGIKFMNRTNSFYGYAVEIVLPFYILHYAVIRLVTFYVVRWHTGIAVKFLSLAVASLILIIVLYDVLIRRLNIMRFLFGMKIRRA
jgi:peptidoglycan/LPS O-acetylase OafA/YrhL